MLKKSKKKIYNQGFWREKLRQVVLKQFIGFRPAWIFNSAGNATVFSDTTDKTTAIILHLLNCVLCKWIEAEVVNNIAII